MREVIGNVGITWVKWFVGFKQFDDNNYAVLLTDDQQKITCLLSRHSQV